MKRSEILAEIAESLSRSLTGRGSYLKRKDNVFFRYGDAACVQRDVVYYGSRKYGLNFELLDMGTSYFTGSKNHALALKEALGGEARPSEYVACVETMDLWIWEGPQRSKQLQMLCRMELPEPLDLSLIKKILFDEEDF